MRILVTGDLHIDVGPYPDSLQRSVSLLSDCYKLARKYGCKMIIYNGDLVNSHTPKLSVLLSLQRHLRRCRLNGVQVVWVRGNHVVSNFSRPDENVMRMFAPFCRIINHIPRPIQTPTTTVYLVPWYPYDTHKLALNRVAKHAIRNRKHRVLVTHVAVREGSVSESNHKAKVPIHLADLHPGLYDLVLLSDYHGHQYLADNTLYLGAPVQQHYGDWGNKGPWILDLNGKPTIDPVELPSMYPRFRTWEIMEESALVLLHYDPEDRNRIKVAMHLDEKVRRMYPEAEIRPVPSDVEETRSRLIDVQERDVDTIWKMFLKTKRWKSKQELKLVYKTGLNYLNKAVPF